MSRLENTSPDILAILAALCDDTANQQDVEKLEELVGEDGKAVGVVLDYLQMHSDLHFELTSRKASANVFQGIALIHGSVDYSPQSVAFSYLVATVLVGIGLLVASLMPMPHSAQVVQQSPSSPSPLVSSPSPAMVFVGRITGMVDCKWADPSTAVIGPVAVPLGRKYALASGLMEITYDTGAKVILQGPCTYEVESPASGYLSIGKLTARVESRESRVESDQTTANDRAADHSRLSTLDSQLFSVRTPTTTVTDLGTEFGVEVGPDGTNQVHVFQGRVELRRAADVGGSAGPIVLSKGQSASVAADGRAVSQSVDDARGNATTFIRQLPRASKRIDLLDIVAGGNGLGHRRERGIDPTTGREDSVFIRQSRDGDRQYHPATYYRLIDGVFVPDGRGPVMLDSAGHTCDLPPTSGRVWGSIWPRAATINQPSDIANYSWNWIYAMGPGKQFMPKGNGLLGMHANAGITFNLAAMRNIEGNASPARFHAVAGLADAYAVDNATRGMADIWVFVDGQLKLKHEKLRPKDGPTEVNVAIAPEDRFLTLVVTDGGDGDQGDWFVFGDPVLEMACEEVTK